MQDIHFRLTLLLLGAVGVQCMYPSNSDVVDLTPNNFDKEVINSDSTWIVAFYVSWCGYCKSLKPEYEKAATALKGTVKVGAVNADDHNSLVDRFQVNGFPTIKIFGADKNKSENYNGARTVADLAQAALNAASQKAGDNL